MSKIQVHDWIATRSPPKTPTEDDMRYGIGCLIDLLGMMTGRMADLLHSVNQYNGLSAEDILEELDRSSFGCQISIIRKNYGGSDVKYEDMEAIRDDRNYFAHSFSTFDYDVRDAARLSGAINRIIRVSNQLGNANDRVSKQNRKKENIQADCFRKMMIKAARSCRPDSEGDVAVAAVGSVISCNPEFRSLKKEYEHAGGLEEYISTFGWKFYWRKKDPNIKYLRLSELDRGCCIFKEFEGPPPLFSHRASPWSSIHSMVPSNPGYLLRMSSTSLSLLSGSARNPALIRARCFRTARSRAESGTPSESRALSTTISLIKTEDLAAFPRSSSLDQRISMLGSLPIRPRPSSLPKEASMLLCSPSAPPAL